MSHLSMQHMIDVQSSRVAICLQHHVLPETPLQGSFGIQDDLTCTVERQTDTFEDHVN